MTLIENVLSAQGHLLTNLPSVDREQCGGHTPNHRTLWGLGPASRDYSSVKYPGRTLTELIRTDFALDDGEYVLSLHIAPFDTDAAPSRPVLFEQT